MKDYEIPKVQINIVTLCEVSRKFMKIEGIYLSIPANVHESSWFDSSGLYLHSRTASSDEDIVSHTHIACSVSGW